MDGVGPGVSPDPSCHNVSGLRSGTAAPSLLQLPSRRRDTRANLEDAVVAAEQAKQLADGALMHLFTPGSGPACGTDSSIYLGIASGLPAALSVCEGSVA